MASSTRLILIDPDEPNFLALADATSVLRQGGLVAFATETVYGLGADATNRFAVARIFEAKGRPASNPLIVHVADEAGAIACVDRWPDEARNLASRFWPGPLTLVLPRSAIIPDIVTAGQDTVGVRVPMPTLARNLIRQVGRPIAAPSANRSNGISPTTAEHVAKDLDGKITMILDSGPTAVGIESTVLDLSGDRPRILRPGPISSAELAFALGLPTASLELADRTSRPRSPGQMAIHYAPTTPTYRVERDHLASLNPPGRYAVIALGPDWPGLPPFAIHLEDPAEAARLLYHDLHACDEQGLDFLMVVPPPEEPEWLAIRDRITRATRPYPATMTSRRPDRIEDATTGADHDFETTTAGPLVITRGRRSVSGDGRGEGAKLSRGRNRCEDRSSGRLGTSWRRQRSGR